MTYWFELKWFYYVRSKSVEWYERHDPWQKVCVSFCMFVHVFIFPMFKHPDVPLFSAGTSTMPTQKTHSAARLMNQSPSRDTSLSFTCTCINKHMQELHRHTKKITVCLLRKHVFPCTKNVEAAILHHFSHKESSSDVKIPSIFYVVALQLLVAGSWLENCDGDELESVSSCL